MTLVKVCGITSPGDAISAAELGADILGLVFAESRRRVSADLAAEIICALKALNRRPAVAGVFVNAGTAYVNSLARELGLDIVQLSGDESADCCQDIGCPVIRVIHIDKTMTESDIEVAVSLVRQADSPGRVTVMLDSRAKGLYGGTGLAFDHALARRVCAAQPVMIAGGLNSENVAGVVRGIRPYGVDVSSGVETGGRKDIKKIRSFIKAVRSADKDLCRHGIGDHDYEKGEKNAAR